jgi:hypothetical protein
MVVQHMVIPLVQMLDMVLGKLLDMALVLHMDHKDLVLDMDHMGSYISRQPYMHVLSQSSLLYN